MNINLTPIFQAVIALIAALITYKLIPWIKSKTTAAQQANLQAVTRMLVFAAEQLYGANHGSEKLRWVEDKLKERGYTVDSAAIEAAVAECLNFGQVQTVELVENAEDENGDAN